MHKRKNKETGIKRSDNIKERKSKKETEGRATKGIKEMSITKKKEEIII